MTEIRFATRADFESFDEPPSHTVRALVIVHEGSVVAVGGLAYFPCCRMAFMQAKNTRPLSIMKATKIVMKEIFSQSGLPIFAARDTSVESSSRYLDHLGFVPLDDDYYIWRGME